MSWKQKEPVFEYNDTTNMDDSFDLSIAQMDIKPEVYLNKQIFQCQNCIKMSDGSNNFQANKAFFIANVNILEGMAKEKKGLLPETDVYNENNELLDKSYDTIIKEYKQTEEYTSLKDQETKMFSLASFKFYKLFGYVCSNQTAHAGLKL